MEKKKLFCIGINLYLSGAVQQLSIVGFLKFRELTIGCELRADMQMQCWWINRILRFRAGTQH